MTKQIQEAYIVSATRTPVGKAPRGMFRNTRPDDLLAHVLKSVLAQAPTLDPASIGDVIVGCAMPEAEQGTNVARIALLLAGLPNTVPGLTINRFCSSGLQAVALAADRIRLGEAEVMIAAGTESMSMVPMMGNKVAINPAIFARDENIAIGFGKVLPQRRSHSAGKSAAKHRTHSPIKAISARCKLLVMANSTMRLRHTLSTVTRRI